MPRAKVANNKPRGRMSAYAFFVQKCREEHKKLHPEESVVFSEFSKKCAEKWKTMDEEDKHGFFDMAKTDKERFDNEMANYDGPLPVRGGKGGKKGKQKKDPNAPKRALSAFFWFSGDERPKVRKESPELGVGDVAKEMGARWKVITPEEKARYQQMADKDKARYAKDIKAYKEGTFGKKVVQKVESESEEEEEEEEEDEEMEDEDDE